MYIDNTWDAFCTVHWFMTGEPIVHKSKHLLTNFIYHNWYIKNTK